MKKVYLVPVIIILILQMSTCSRKTSSILYFENANSRPTYFSIHNIEKAWKISRGAGVKVGVLDHSFGFEVNRDLYAEGKAFQKDNWSNNFNTESHHGFWMASTLREIAPEVEIYPLGTYSSNKDVKVQAMIEAIDWAIDNNLDVLTYSAEKFSKEHQILLNKAINKAHEHGIVTTFIHYPHPGNILPTGLFPQSGDDERDPDINILHYDYSVLFAERYTKLMKPGSNSTYRPFLSISSTSPVTAGFAAMMISLKPNIGSEEIRQILIDTSYELEFENRVSLHTADIYAALKYLLDQ